MHSHLEGAEAVRERDKERIKEKGGMGALERIYELKKELVDEVGDEKVVDAAGMELPLTLREVVRTKSVVDEAGLVNIVDSKMKVKVAARSIWPADKSFMVSVGMLFLYMGIASALMIWAFNPDVYDQGGGACHEAESLKIMMEMDMSTTEGLFLCTDSACSATMAVTTTGVEHGWDSTSSFSEAEDICYELRRRNGVFIFMAAFIQGGTAIWSLLGGFLTGSSLRSLLARSKDADPNVITDSNAVVTAGSLGLRLLLILAYSNWYAADYVTLFVDLFLVFVFAELMDIFVARIMKPYIDAVKKEISDFDASWTRLEKADPLFAFTPPAGQDRPKDVKVDADGCIIYPAYKEGSEDGKKGELAGFYFTSSDPDIRKTVSRQSCLPNFIFSPYSSALNARFKMLFKEDDKKRHVKEDEANGDERRHLYYVE